MATHRKEFKKTPEYTTEEFQDSSRELYNIRSFIKKAFDFSFVQTALYMTEAVHEPQCPLHVTFYIYCEPCTAH